MTKRITSFPVLGFAELFQPRGIPLTKKGDGEAPPSTSVLVRGGPGVGKTTLSVGIAHGIAKALGAPVLYLGTEFVPSEIKFKGSVLKLGKVLSWSQHSEAKAGAIVVQHLALASASGSQSQAPIKEDAIEAAWRLSVDSDHKFGAIIIDAFISSEEGETNKGLRAKTLALVQALESKGVTPVLVQEQSDNLNWLAFVVDVVVGLTFAADGDTGELQRKLTLSKSRYAMSHAGPHDYGLDSGVPSVWPNLLASVYGLTETRLAHTGVVFAVDEEHAVVLPRGGLVLSDFEDPSILDILYAIPGRSLVTVRCGPVTTIEGDGESLTAPDWEGPFSIGWAAFRIAKDTGANILLIHGIESLLRRNRFRVGLLHVIEAFVESGVLVCVHGDARALQAAFGPRFAHARKGPARTGGRLAGSSFLLATRWVTRPVRVAVQPAEGPDAIEAARIRQATTSQGADVAGIGSVVISWSGECLGYNRVGSRP
ncbi:MAG: ATPase domain-containing protein [Archangium sp.]